MTADSVKLDIMNSDIFQYTHGDGLTLETHLGDCLKVMDDLIQQKIKVDAIITDPPFFTPATHYQSRVNWSKSWADMSILETWWAEVVKRMSALLHEHGHIIVFCNSDSYPVFFPVMFTRWDKLKCLVWDKGHVGLGRIFRNQHELAIWGRNSGHFIPDDGKLRADVLKFKATPSKDRTHPVEKPISMMGWLIEATSQPGGIVLDPFMGSGTTGLAAFTINRSFIGIEKDPSYFDMVKKRIKNHTAQTRLF